MNIRISCISPDRFTTGFGHRVGMQQWRVTGDFGSIKYAS